jgi:hypothetical protein
MYLFEILSKILGTLPKLLHCHHEILINHFSVHELRELYMARCDFAIGCAKLRFPVGE